MSITDAKNLITEKLGWTVQDIFYVRTDPDMFDYYLVYKNHRIKCLVAIDNLNKCVTGIWE
mgnify:CR=1 FL=1